jgi:serine phosphatase RsbU (regulator of sigma subunit)
VIETVGRRTMVAIGDVSGHGVTSGLAMMMARASLVAVLEANPRASLAEIYRVLNRCLRLNFSRMGVSRYMTFALIEYLGEGRLTAVGGHLPILIYRRSSGRIEEIELEGMWLGVMDELDEGAVPETPLVLGPEDRLILYTDGIVEHSSAGRMFGFERLKELIHRHSDKAPAELIDSVLREVDRFSGLREDDMTMLVVDHRGVVNGSPPVGQLTAPPLASDAGH